MTIPHGYVLPTELLYVFHTSSFVCRLIKLIYGLK